MSDPTREQIEAVPDEALGYWHDVQTPFGMQYRTFCPGPMDWQKREHERRHGELTRDQFGAAMKQERLGVSHNSIDEFLRMWSTDT